MPEWSWLLWYYGHVLELPYAALCALATWGQPLDCVTADGHTMLLLNDRLHCLYGPAIIYENGTKGWCRHGDLHRVDGPAMEWPSGYREWYCHNQLHRENGPAIESPNGTNDWYFHGELYRQEWSRP